MHMAGEAALLREEQPALACIAGMVRRLALDLPLAVGGMVSAVAVTQLLIDVVDAISAGILSGFGTDIRTFLDGVATVSDWVINAGSNTLLTTGTLNDPTVTFAPSTQTGFPQAVTVDPTATVGPVPVSLSVPLVFFTIETAELMPK